MTETARTDTPLLRGLRPLLPAVALLAAAATGAAAAGAQNDGDDDAYYRYASLSQVEGDVWHQRADDFGANEAEINSPFLPGDRIWTREPGRVEIRFSGWVTVWMDEGTKLDYVEADQPHRLGFWTGSLFLRVGEESEVVVETPGGNLTPQGEGLYRLDVLPDRRSVQFAVREGIAAVSNEAGSVLVRAGNRTVASAESAPSAPEAHRADDDFVEWASHRQARFVRDEDLPYDDLPHEVREHAHDLKGHGHWTHDHTHGWLWYPAVASGWSPYYHGRWAHTPFGYTWISYDPWGWAPFHYGRWGHGPRGWYWMPGSAWSPGWVSWAYGPDWIGWSPLGAYGYPVYGFDGHYRGGGYGRVARGTVVGTAVRRGEATRRTGRRGDRTGWAFTHRKAIGRAASRNRLAASSLRRVGDARVLEQGAVLDRGLSRRAVGETAIARSARVTARGLSNDRALTRGAASTRRRASAWLNRSATANPSAGTAPRAAASAGGERRASSASRRVARPRSVTARPTAGDAAAARTGSRTNAARPRSGASSASSGSRARPSSGSRARPSSGNRARPRATARPRSGSGNASSSRPRSTTRSRPSSASRSRPSSASRSRPSSASRSRPSSASRSRPSGNRARPRSGASSRPSSTSRSRPSSASRSRPSSTSRSRPSSTSRTRPSSTSRTRPSSGSRPAPRASGNRSSGTRSSGSRSSGSRARPRRPNR